MYRVSKEFSFEAAHSLITAAHSQKCLELHGHSYKVTIFLTVDRLTEEGMVLDFTVLSTLFQPLLAELDHSVIEPSLLISLGVPEPANPTAENMAFGICCYLTARLNRYIEREVDDIKRFKFMEVQVQETAKCAASYIGTFNLVANSL
jgi:6-pyruvoyltetrahydropterin/6-carboxytetrahydropterin synthase